MTVVDAMDLAAEGQLADGCAALLAGLHRAEEIAEEGIKWGPDLLARWRLVCDRGAVRGVARRPSWAERVSGQTGRRRSPPARFEGYRGVSRTAWP